MKTINNYKDVVTLLLPNWNNAPILDLFFKRLIKNTKYENLELIVVDDGSTDNSLKILEHWEMSSLIKNMRIIQKEHSGIVSTLNAGLKYAKGEFICRFDGDALIDTSNWLQKILFFIKTNPDIGMVVAKIVFPDGTLHSAGRNVICQEGLHDRGTTISEEIGQRTFEKFAHGLGHVIRVKDDGKFDDIAEVDTALGCCTLFRKDLADKIGGFDENFEPVWIEDDDFGLSIRKHGKKVFYFPEVKVIHCRMRALENTLLSKMYFLGTRLIFNFPSQAQRFIMSLTSRINNRPRKTDPWRANILKNHYEYWKVKWDFDLINPNMADILARWGHTEICWHYDEKMKKRGDEIISNYLRLKQKINKSCIQ